MSISNPPPGHVDCKGAAELIGLTPETIRLAAVTGELKGMQRTKRSPWFFKPSDLRRWRGIDEPTEVAS